jgi:hypothetical protein
VVWSNLLQPKLKPFQGTFIEVAGRRVAPSWLQHNQKAGQHGLGREGECADDPLPRSGNVPDGI